MADFDTALAIVLENEGGISEDKDDAGGTTNAGISLRFYKSIKPTATSEDILALTPEQISDVYKTQFWDAAPFSQIPYQKICNVIFDGCVTTGIAPTIKCVQRAIWACGGNMELFPDDGIMGEKTIQFIRQSGYSLLPAIRSERASLYRQISTHSNNDNKFLKGWLRRAYTTG